MPRQESNLHTRFRKPVFLNSRSTVWVRPAPPKRPVSSLTSLSTKGKAAAFAAGAFSGRDRRCRSRMAVKRFSEMKAPGGKAKVPISRSEALLAQILVRNLGDQRGAKSVSALSSCGFSNAEIAKLLDMKANAVNQAIFRARRRPARRRRRK